MMTLGRRRAKNALERTKELAARPDAFKKNYRAYVDRIGPAIVMNGLGQALATEQAAASPSPRNDRERAHYELYESLGRWICGKGDVYESGEDLLQAIVANNEDCYIRAQAEALAWLGWHKKFCRAYFPADEGAVE